MTLAVDGRMHSSHFVAVPAAGRITPLSGLVRFHVDDFHPGHKFLLSSIAAIRRLWSEKRSQSGRNFPKPFIFQLLHILQCALRFSGRLRL
jgi:hypothetical protein